MGLFYKVSEKDLLEIRNKIFLEKGIPSLSNNNFQKSPFPNSWYGKDDIGGYTYEMCRVTNNSYLEIVTSLIVKGDKWIKIYLNIFKLQPELKSLSELQSIDGIKFDLPPNSITKMRLRSDDYKGPPLLYMLFLPEHKIKSFHSKNGLEKRAEELGILIEQDLMNIDSFVNRWHELHKPNLTDWEGNVKK